MLIIQLCTLYANFLYATQTDLCALISLKLLGKKANDIKIRKIII